MKFSHLCFHSEGVQVSLFYRSFAISEYSFCPCIKCFIIIYLSFCKESNSSRVLVFGEEVKLKKIRQINDSSLEAERCCKFALAL